MNLKKAMTLLFFAFVVFFIIQSPVEAGVIFRDSASALGRLFVSAAKAFSTFLQTLF